MAQLVHPLRLPSPSANVEDRQFDMANEAPKLGSHRSVKVTTTTYISSVARLFSYQQVEPSISTKPPAPISS
jgi:hypothetical protein